MKVFLINSTPKSGRGENERWIVHSKIKKPKVNKGQYYSSKRQVKHFVIALNMIMIKIDRKSSSIRNDHLKGVKDNGSALLYLS